MPSDVNDKFEKGKITARFNHDFAKALADSLGIDSITKATIVVDWSQRPYPLARADVEFLLSDEQGNYITKAMHENPPTKESDPCKPSN